MANGMKCANCGKGVMYGHNVSHAKNRTQKIFKPNLHATKVVINGTSRKMRLCTKCLRMYKKYQLALTEKNVVVTETPDATPTATA